MISWPVQELLGNLRYIIPCITTLREFRGFRRKWPRGGHLRDESIFRPDYFFPKTIRSGRSQGDGLRFSCFSFLGIATMEFKPVEALLLDGVRCDPQRLFPASPGVESHLLNVEGIGMTVTLDLMSAFVACRYKAYLKCIGKTGNVTEYETLQQQLAGEYVEVAAKWYAQRFSPAKFILRPIALYDVLPQRYRLVLDASSEKQRPCVVFPAIERLTEKATKKTHHTLVVVSPNVKLSRYETITASILASAISRCDDIRVRCVKFIHGVPFSITKVALLGTKGPTHVAEQSATGLHDLEALVAEPIPPPMYLNDHCTICEYHDECRNIAVDRDDLSLLRGLQPKEIEAWKRRGIFTVTQLAYTFRAKTMGRKSQQPRRHSQPLQAMAIRDKKTYVGTRPEMPPGSTRVFFDVEGVPEREGYYLIGAVVVKDGAATSHRFWAEDVSKEEGVWNEFLGLLTELDDYVLVHYGRYDRDFIRKMRQRYGGDDLTSRLFDVHAAIRTKVFFPIYSNSLKEIASFLGFRWQGPVRSGIDSIVWRYKWEKSGDSHMKEDLLRYNHEDCLALMAVFDHLAAISTGPEENTCTVDGRDGVSESRQNSFGKKTFAFPAMKTITKCAYFSYQQQKVFFRTDKHVRRSLRRKRQSSKTTVKVNTVLQHGQADMCPRCMGSITLLACDRQTKIVRDLKFFRGGVKRWIIRHSTARYACQSCNHTFYSPSYPTKQPMFGHGVASWAVYRHVALCQSYESVTASVNDAFGYGFSTGMVKRSHQQ